MYCGKSGKVSDVRLNAFTLHSVFIIFSQKEKAGTVEKVVKFVACIVENSLRVGDNCIRVFHFHFHLYI